MQRRAGEIEYELTYKKVKNLNLRVQSDGAVAVSAPKRVPLHEIDHFVLSRAGWIEAARQRTFVRRTQLESPERYTEQECLRAFEAISARFYPLFSRVLPAPPALKVRRMKSRWGVCHIQKRQITLNTRLMEQPLAAQEYVVLHEYVHFLYPDHQKGFHAAMERLMPDYKERRKLLAP